MRIFKYISACLLLTVINSQEILKDGEQVTTFTYDEALDMLKARDAQWEDVQYKEKSQSLHVLIWAGLAILTILFVMKKFKK